MLTTSRSISRLALIGGFPCRTREHSIRQNGEQERSRSLNGLHIFSVLPESIDQYRRVPRTLLQLQRYQWFLFEDYP